MRNTYREPGSDRIPCSPRRRAGFTMIEMLIVVVIIAILATLTFRGIAAAQRRARQAQETNDITQLGFALQQFKERFGVYPPSRIRLRENTAYITSGATPDAFDQHSVKYLKRIWPSIQITQANAVTNLTEAQCILWCKDVPGKQQQGVGITGTLASGGTTTGKTYELEGDECLVFFLGGIAEFDRANITSRPIIMHGFSKNAKNPGGTPNSADPTTVSRDGPFFTFDAGRLFIRQGTTQVAANVPNTPANIPPDFNVTTARPDKLPSYRSFQTTEASPVPIAYFSAYEGQGYRPMDCYFPEELCGDGIDPLTAQIHFQITWPGISQDDPGTMNTYHPIAFGPNPYTMTRAAPISDSANLQAGDADPVDSAGAIVRPFEPQSYQLISPGADGKLGRGGKLPPAGDFNTTNPDYDNISNVAGGQTVGIFAESLRKKQ